LAALACDLPACDPAAGDGLDVAFDASSGPLGFIQYSPAAITDGTWFVYWIAVAKHTHGCGIGARLLNHAEERITAQGGRLVQIETSSKPIYAATRRFYLGRGYTQVAQIPDYYADGDDLCVFQRRL
jgi:ribosomal protein S18 acetylase RimI-like enzyme